MYYLLRNHLKLHLLLIYRTMPILNAHLEDVFKTNKYLKFSKQYDEFNKSCIRKEIDKGDFGDPDDFDIHLGLSMSDILIAQKYAIASPWNRTCQRIYILLNMTSIQNYCNPCYPFIISNYNEAKKLYKEFEWEKHVEKNLKHLKYIVSTDIYDDIGDINDVDPFGNTALMIACYGPLPNLPIIQYLIYLGANPNVRNKNSDNCFQIAEKYGMKDIIDYLTLTSYPSLKYEHEFLKCIKNPERLNTYLDRYKGIFDPDVLVLAIDRSSPRIMEIIQTGLDQNSHLLVLKTLEKHQHIIPFVFDKKILDNHDLIREIVVDLIDINNQYGFYLTQDICWFQAASMLHMNNVLQKLIDNSDTKSVCDYFTKFSLSQYIMPFLESKKNTFDIHVVKLAWLTNMEIANSMCQIGIMQGEIISVSDSLWFSKFKCNRKFQTMAFDLFKQMNLSKTFVILMNVMIKNPFFEDRLLFYCFQEYKDPDDEYIKLASKLVEELIITFYNNSLQKCVNSKNAKSYDDALRRCIDILKNNFPDSSKFKIFQFIEYVFRFKIDDDHFDNLLKSSAECLVTLSAFRDGLITLDSNASNSPNESLIRFTNICSMLDGDSLQNIANVMNDKSPQINISSIYVEKALHKILLS